MWIHLVISYVNIYIDIIYEWAIVQFANCEFTDPHWFYTEYLPIIPILDDPHEDPIKSSLAAFSGARHVHP